MSEYLEQKNTDFENTWITKDADGEHTREDAPTTPPEYVAPISISELEELAVDHDRDPLATFGHRDNGELELWVWNAETGAVLEYYCEPGYSIAYWTSKGHLKDILEYAFDNFSWNLSGMRPSAVEAAIDTLGDLSEDDD